MLNPAQADRSRVKIIKAARERMGRRKAAVTRMCLGAGLLALALIAGVL